MLGQLRQVSLSEIDVTSGTISERTPGQLTTSDPSVRATLLRGRTTYAAIQFCYLGPVGTPDTSGDRTEFHQVGLKLRSLNPCNLVYVMWRIQPRHELAVLVKRNDGMSTSGQCSNNGYRIIERVTYPCFEGALHELLAQVSTDRTGSVDVTVWVDWQEAMRATIPTDLITGIDGPPGFRSDNGRFEFRLFTAIP